MTKNINLHAAKAAKKDEFYTQLTDIENELQHYKDFFRGKAVHCNCDSPTESNFPRYFLEHFDELGLERLTATCYVPGGRGWKGEKRKGGEYTVEQMDGDGDFRSKECIELLKEADVVVTNPPFSLFREYVAQLMYYGKKFLIIGNMNAITYKEIFPYIKDNKLWLGCRGLGKDFFFNLTDEYKKETLKAKKQGCGWKIIDGEIMGRVASACWFTNIPHAPAGKTLVLEKHYSPEEYPKYDNYDAVEVSRVADIPVDYDGVMGVPITYIQYHCPEQFEIVGFRKGDDDKDLSVNGKCPYFRVLIRRKYALEPADFEIVGLMSGAKDATLINGDDGRVKFYIDGKGVYARILIRRK